MRKSCFSTNCESLREVTFKRVSANSKITINQTSFPARTESPFRDLRRWRTIGFSQPVRSSVSFFTCSIGEQQENSKPSVGKLQFESARRSRFNYPRVPANTWRCTITRLEYRTSSSVITIQFHENIDGTHRLERPDDNADRTRHRLQ